MMPLFTTFEWADLQSRMPFLDRGRKVKQTREPPRHNEKPRTTRLHYRWAAFYSTQDCEHVPGRSPCARSGQASPAHSHFCSAGRTRPQLVENIHRSDDDESASCTPFSPKLTVRCKLGTRLGPVVDLSPPHHALAPISTLRERGQGDQREAGSPPSPPSLPSSRNVARIVSSACGAPAAALRNPSTSRPPARKGTSDALASERYSQPFHSWADE
ncbi:hypothetical protein HPB47_013378 [Ixodes persulcatus]|uniref:Uncharacterized protein n=1 Tax=Ixodes persulcatus TaxID=34615 RepID=A0AC60R1Z9_IXOPE|nr:hypothetical protein HPB47_013378 [Ixodes persulcatus]